MSKSSYNKHVLTKNQMIVKESKEEKIFINKLIKVIRNINTSDLSNVDFLKNVILILTSSIERI